jgi:tetratricopeptide (TPR) repeat protein
MKRESQKERLERCLNDVEENPSKASAHYNLALAYTVSARVADAEEAYLKAVELDPTMVQAWVNLGGVRMMRWDFEGCLKANQEAVGLRDDLTQVHFNMGQAYLYLNDPENLLECNKRVLELERDHPAGHYYSAVAHLALDDHGAAERHLARAIELGHAPTQDFVKAMERAQMKKAREENVTLIEITGAPDPEKPRED